MQKYVIRELGIRPLTKEQWIHYFQTSNELLDNEAGLYYEKEVLKYNKDTRKKEPKIKRYSYSSYEDYFNKMLKEGYIEKAPQYI